MLARILVFAATAGGFLVSETCFGAIDIQFDYRYDSGGFFGSPAARAALEDAAATFDVILDDLSPISPSGRNRWTANFFNPATGADETLDNLFIPANTLTIFVGGRNLGGETLGLGGPGGFSGSGISQSWFDVLFGRGEGPQSAVSGIFAEEFGPWGGSMSFDTLNPNGQQRNWHFDVNTDPARNTTDFYSVAVHELAHVLGFGTADSFQNLSRQGYFEGTQAKSLNNGQRIRLSPDNDHWAAETRSPPWDDEGPVAAMDPTIITVNDIMRRRLFTPLDFAALDDLGWTIDPSVYEPPPDPVSGDYNGNGLVEQADLDLVLTNWGTSATAVPSTWTNDPPVGFVDQGELDGVLTSWGAGAASAGAALNVPAAAVPEPGTSLLVLVMLASLLLRFRLRLARR